MSYVAHIVEQIQHNVGFLVDNGHMSRQDADAVLSRLPGQEPVNAGAVMPAPVSAPSPAPRRVPALPVAASKAIKAKALWAYNDNGEDPNDLSFRPGDLIDIVEETNADWWTGKINGKQGLFPSNYVEKLPATEFRSVPPIPSRTNSLAAPPSQYEQSVPVAPKTPYRSFGAVYHGADKPPPPGSGSVNSVGLQEADGQDKKKSKYGGLKNTMAHSAAGGVGFGAGAAIGGGLVRAIF